LKARKLIIINGKVYIEATIVSHIISLKPLVPRLLVIQPVNLWWVYPLLSLHRDFRKTSPSSYMTLGPAHSHKAGNNCRALDT
jgi:hypothetical protein